MLSNRLHYEFTGETKVLDCGTVVRRIRRLSDGLIGGWIENYGTISDNSNSFVYDDSMVYGNSRIFENSQVRGKVVVKNSLLNNSELKGNFLVQNSEIHRSKLFFGDYINRRVKSREILNRYSYEKILKDIEDHLIYIKNLYKSTGTSLSEYNLSFMEK